MQINTLNTYKILKLQTNSKINSSVKTTIDKHIFNLCFQTSKSNY